MPKRQIDSFNIIAQFVILCFLFGPIEVHGQSNLAGLVNKYWEATTLNEKQRVAKEIIATKPSFTELRLLLSNGKKYGNEKTGFIKLPQQGQNLPPQAALIVPLDYSPDQQYPVQIYLHGAVSNMDPFFLYRYTVDTLNTELYKSKSILVFPAAWNLAPWWSQIQLKNILQLLEWVKNKYNIDENRIRLSGVSDGGIGCYYLSNCDQTIWSTITPFIGSVRALTKVGDRQVYFNNFANAPLFIVNTGKDHIFDISWEKPFVENLILHNAMTSFVQVDSSGHSLGWFPVLKGSINEFVKQNPRNPFPDELIWQTDDTDKFNRLKYVVIEKLGITKSKGEVEDNNSVNLLGKETLAFARNKPSGILKLQKRGNAVHVNAQGVKQYKLLLSPDHFDFSKPIVVITNGIKSFDGVVTSNIETLLKWNAIDNDRTMLFGAELKIKIN